MSVIGKTNQHVHVAVRMEIIRQHGAKKGQPADTVSFAKYGNPISINFNVAGSRRAPTLTHLRLLGICGLGFLQAGSFSQDGSIFSLFKPATARSG